MAKKSNYEEQIKELEKIITQLEDEEISVDELTGKVKRAAEIITYCRTILKSTEAEVDQILKGLKPE